MAANLRKLPLGIQDFEKLRTSGCLYVDKTKYVYELVTKGFQLFLGRPRRFGKSLLLSTLKAYFLGKKELFEELAIAELEQEWLEYPVIYLDFNRDFYSNISSFDAVMNYMLSLYEAVYGKNPEEKTYPLRFEGIIHRAFEKTGRKVVVLVDEYDKPLLGTMDDLNANDDIRKALKGFYGVLKANDACLRFVFLTGVTKFSKVSIFSDLNHLTDISLDKKFAGICGISEKELIENLEPEIQNLAQETGKTYDVTLAKMKKRYDGYHFAKECVGIYNPYSVLHTLNKCDFGDYWFETGTPTFLVKMIRNMDLDIRKFTDDTTIQSRSLMDYRVEWNDPIPILYQSGYLTIKGYDEQFDEYVLGYPNEEVKYGFLNELLPAYGPNPGLRSDFDSAKFTRDLLQGNVEQFMLRLHSYLSSIQFDLENKTEKHFQTIFYLLFSMMGQFVKTEEHSSAGSSDAVVITPDYVYIFEFKITGNGTADEALKQIEEKNYAGVYKIGNRKIVKIGAVIDLTKRIIGEWKHLLSDTAGFMP
jgi:hypothetical protein